MFGSLGFLVDGTLRIAVGEHGDRVAMVRTGAGQEAALHRPGTTPMVMRGRELTGWVALSRDAVAEAGDVAHWVGVALAAVEPEKVFDSAETSSASARTALSAAEPRGT